MSDDNLADLREAQVGTTPTFAIRKGLAREKPAPRCKKVQVNQNLWLTLLRRGRNFRTPPTNVAY